jgi:hypothetical protein
MHRLRNASAQLARAARVVKTLKLQPWEQHNLEKLAQASESKGLYTSIQAFLLQHLHCTKSAHTTDVGLIAPHSGQTEPSHTKSDQACWPPPDPPRSNPNPTWKPSTAQQAAPNASYLAHKTTHQLTHNYHTTPITPHNSSPDTQPTQPSTPTSHGWGGGHTRTEPYMNQGRPWQETQALSQGFASKLETVQRDHH